MKVILALLVLVAVASAHVLVPTTNVGTVYPQYNKVVRVPTYQYPTTYSYNYKVPQYQYVYPSYNYGSVPLYGSSYYNLPYVYA